jgi:hypothetical protein
MKRFINFITSLYEEAEKHHVMAFIRANPITKGHQAVINAVQHEAKNQKASHSVVLSHSHDEEKNPLTPEQKVKHAKRAFPGVNVTTSSSEKPSILHHLSDLHNQGVEHVTIVGGSDREPFEQLAQKYNGVEGKHGFYKFKSINFVRAGGERKETPSGSADTGVESWSASRMRAAAKNGNRQEFHAGAPDTMSTKHKDEMYGDVRKGMGIKD